MLHPPGPMGPPATSAAHVLALLDEDDDSLKLHALQQLDRSVHDFWFQISSSIAAIEALYEDDEFSHRELAALVASKVRPRGAAVGGSAIGGHCGRRRARWRDGCPTAAAAMRAAGGAPQPTRPRLPPLLAPPAARCSTTWATWTMR